MTIQLGVVFGLVLSLMTGCAMVDPFTLSDEAMMARVAKEIQFGDDLDTFFKQARGKGIVMVNMEANRYTDDQNPEYLIHDAFYTRLTGSDARIMLLDRDPDILTLLERERDGLDLPAKWSGPGAPSDSLSPEKRREEVGKLIRDLVKELAKQDVLVVQEKGCCDGKGGGGKLAKENMLANEVGEVKAKLLRSLVDEYLQLHPLQKPAKADTRHIDLNTADYLVAYRVYDFGAWKNPINRGNWKRINYLKLHVRVIEMNNGAIIVSNMMEHRIDDELTGKEVKGLMKSQARQSDYGRPSKRTPDNGKQGGVKRSGPAAPASEGKKKGFLGGLFKKK